MKPLVIIISLFSLLSSIISPAQAAVAVIAHPSVANADHKIIKKIFLNKANQISGEFCTPVDQPFHSPIRVAFVHKVLGQTMEDNHAYWTEQIFTGQGIPPKEVENDAKVKAFVSSTPGAVGYVDEALIDHTVKVLFIK
jgi:ABC-type phosphate transport system substrate-binding protein